MWSPIIRFLGLTWFQSPFTLPKSFVHDFLGDTLVPSQNEIHHEINYIELSATDVAEAKRFYSAAFEWQFNDYAPGYVGIRRKESSGECGGICQAEQVARGGPLVILYSVDLEASLASVQAAGGTITQEIISFPGGRRFHFLDPSGNELAVWSDKTQPQE